MAATKREIEKVGVVRCSDYRKKNVEVSVKKSLKLIGFKFKNNSKVLLKPNIVGAFPNQKAVTTNPVLIEAVCKILKKHRCKIFIGDSPFTNPEDSFAKSKIEKIAKKYGKLIIFEQDKLVKVFNKDAKILKQFPIPKIVKEADLIINMPKLKTHRLTKYTGAVKNIYGVIPGGLKQKLHLKARGEKKFSKLLIDIYQNINPGLTIMDGVIAMEGDGPTAGKIKKAGLILASKNGIALDIAATKIIGLRPRSVYTTKFAVKRKLYPNFKISVVGIKKLPNLKFKLPIEKSSATQRLLNKIFREKPITVDENKCVKCGLCARKCPRHAITLKPFPEIDRKKCIRCYCCMEICPQHALHLKGNK